MHVRAAAAFGPSRITVTTAVAARINALVSLDTLQPGEYLFHADDRRLPLQPYMWTRLVQSTFKAHSGVALSPKTCRASFITWMRDGDHGDDVLASAAQAMHHSSATARSAAYDKGESDRLVAAAVKVADEFAKRFVRARAHETLAARTAPCNLSTTYQPELSQVASTMSDGGMQAYISGKEEREEMLERQWRESGSRRDREPPHGRSRSPERTAIESMPRRRCSKQMAYVHVRD